MNNSHDYTNFSDNDIDEILKNLFQIDERNECTEEVRERLWNKVKESMEFPTTQKFK